MCKVVILTHAQSAEIQELQETMGQPSREGCWKKKKKGRKSLKARFSAFCQVFRRHRTTHNTMDWGTGCSACSPHGGHFQSSCDSSHRSTVAAGAFLTRAQPAAVAQIAASLPLFPQSSRLTLHPSSSTLAWLFSADHEQTESECSYCWCDSKD